MGDEEGEGDARLAVLEHDLPVVRERPHLRPLLLDGGAEAADDAEELVDVGLATEERVVEEELRTNAPTPPHIHRVRGLPTPKQQRGRAVEARGDLGRQRADPIHGNLPSCPVAGCKTGAEIRFREIARGLRFRD